MSQNSHPAISVIVPLLNEDESLPELASWIERVMTAHGYTYEVLFIDDGSTDKSWSVIQELGRANSSMRGIRMRRNYGKSAALSIGFSACKGKVVITMDADLQDSPDEIPGLYSMITDEGYDLVSGWKRKRYDPISKTLPSKFFNWTTRRMSKVKNLHDFNCGLKAYRSEVVKSIEVYGEMHRYIPVIASWAGFNRIGEKIVEHRERKYGTTKFGLERFVNGFLDLLSISFSSKFGKKPMHLFGLLGSIFFMVGFVIAAYLMYEKIFNQVFRMTERPLFYFGLLAMVIGTQLFVGGFLGELISRVSPDRNNYHVAEKSNISE